MQAVRFHEYGDSSRLVYESIPRPEPKANEVLIKVRFAGINPIDWKLRSGLYRAFMPVNLPFVPGIDVSGTIEELGAGVAAFEKGQAVFGVAAGAYAEYAIAAATDITVIPEGVSFELAAALPVGSLTAWQTVEDARIAAGQRVMVLGAAGGVGLFAVQFARLKGASVTGVAATENINFVKSLGVEEAIDYRVTPLETVSRRFDVVIDTVGGESLETAYGLLRKGGVLVSVAGQVSDAKAKSAGIKALSSHRGPTALLPKIGELLASKKIKAELRKVFAFTETREAQDLCQSGHGRGRIILKVGD